MNEQATRASENATRRTTAMVLIGAYFLFSPALPQLFDAGRPWVRQWTMFGGVGTGLLKGDFIFTTDNGETQWLSTLDVLDRDRYPVATQFYRFDDLILEDSDFARLAGRYCTENPEVRGELVFKGRLGHGKGWRDVEYRAACGDEQP